MSHPEERINVGHIVDLEEARVRDRLAGLAMQLNREVHKRIIAEAEKLGLEFPPERETPTDQDRETIESILTRVDVEAIQREAAEQFEPERERILEEMYQALKDL